MFANDGWSPLSTDLLHEVVRLHQWNNNSAPKGGYLLLLSGRRRGGIYPLSDLQGELGDVLQNPCYLGRDLLYGLLSSCLGVVLVGPLFRQLVCFAVAFGNCSGWLR